MNPVVVFEPNAYLLTGPSLVGRQSAGAGFLRAAVAARGDGPMRGYTPRPESAKAFAAAVRAIDPAAATEWIPGRRIDRIAEVGLIYRPDHEIHVMARQRLRLGPAAYSLCGVTHTLATSRVLGGLASLPPEPVMPWDALICTSQAALSVVRDVLGEAAALLRWRTRQTLDLDGPMLPVIPLGVHTGDFSFTPEDRAVARAALGLSGDEVAFLSAGRLSVHAKAHPHALLLALQRTAQATGRALVLVFAGQAANADIKAVYERAAATYCPSVRTIFVDGKDAPAYRSAWAGADVFVSLADSIQETFGLTPIEAMAAGLPALVSDWDGYRDTVRDGVDGFRITTWTPAPGGGQDLAHDFETGALDYDHYLYASATAVALDLDQLVARMSELAADPDLRRRMGAAGQVRARTLYDWRAVYRSYQALWREQDTVRRRALAETATRGWLAEAPRRAPEHMGPFDAFKDFPTRHVGPETGLSLVRDLGVDAYRELVADPLINRQSVTPAAYDVISTALREGAKTVADVVQRTSLDEGQVIEAVARLAKIGVIALVDIAG